MEIRAPKTKEKSNINPNIVTVLLFVILASGLFFILPSKKDIKTIETKVDQIKSTIHLGDALIAEQFKIFESCRVNLDFLLNKTPATITIEDGRNIPITQINNTILDSKNNPQ